jgi:hypothetical protein
VTRSFTSRSSRYVVCRCCSVAFGDMGGGDAAGATGRRRVPLPRGHAKSPASGGVKVKVVGRV